MLTVIELGSGYLHLPSTRTELEKIEKYAPNEQYTQLGTSKSLSSVLSLSTATFAHFPCHGIQRLDKPLDSTLLVN